VASSTYDAVVVGAGHNGLVAAAYLAREGLRTLVLERRDRAGGLLGAEEISPRIQADVVDTVGRLRHSIVRDLHLRQHGFTPIAPAVRAFAPAGDDGPPVTLWSDPRRTVDDLRSRSPRDAERFVGFDRKVRSVASFLAHVQASEPPDLDSPSVADALVGVKLGRALRGLGGERQVRETLRVLPMAVADLVQEAFDDPALCGLLAARGVRYSATGPWSAGTALNLLWESAGGGGVAGETVYTRGGGPALANAFLSAARAYGADVRCGTEVAGIRTHRGSVAGIVLDTGEEVDAPVVASNADPARTILHLLDPVDAGPTLAWRAEHIRTPGVVAKVSLVLDRLPALSGADPEALRGRIVMAPSIDHLERAFDASKYGQISSEPFLEATIPTLSDPTRAPEGTHLMNVLFQFAPRHLRDGDWASERDRLADLTMTSLERTWPSLSERVTARHVLTPEDLERDHGLTGGHPMHGEHALDQFFAWRPLLGHARYRLAGIRGLYLCGAGAHPGGGITGGPGANASRAILADLRRGDSRRAR
jgi:phytoene dehydrogenase-like protein